MIQLTKIEVRGQSDAGPFGGVLGLSPGLQVVSARNAYGKSLAVKAVAWCLGIEPIFGTPDNDPSCFPEAARDKVDLSGHPSSRVLSSECSVSFRHEDGRDLRLTRPIRGDCSAVSVEETSPDGYIRKSKLLARREVMKDEHGGLQHFLFEWLKLPREEVATFRGSPSEVYLENLAPLFYIDQAEGWTDLQALQISRYGQQQIAEIAVEYLLGATEKIRQRFVQQQANQQSLMLRETARAIADRVNATLLRHGWQVQWSGHGSVEGILTRWSARKLKEILKEEANVDFAARRIFLDERAEHLRKALTSGPVDADDASAPSGASQEVVELKKRRHELNEQLHILRTQYEEAKELVTSLDDRIRAATDLLRLKTTGVGRLDNVECPTCHRDLDPDTFALTQQSQESIEAHIEALKRDRSLMKKNLQSLDADLTSTSAQLLRLDEELRSAERTLMTITAAVGTVREQLAKTAADLTATENERDRVLEVSRTVDDLQDEVDQWISVALRIEQPAARDTDLQARCDAFVKALRDYSVSLGHSEVTIENTALLKLDEQYVPYLNNRRLRSLGSASDQSRLVAAYSLALAAASEHVHGLHPGIVILDEPLHQNPDDPHRDLFLTFLSRQLARQAKFQTIIFTWLRDDEIDRLRRQGTNVITAPSDHFLQLIPSAA